MKKRLTPTARPRKGLISIITVFVVGIFCLALMVASYQGTIRSLNAQRKIQVQLDYEAREQALVRSFVTLAPVYAANSMMDNSQSDGFKDNVSFDSLYEEAGRLASFSKGLDTDQYPNIKADLNIADDATSLNVADADYDSALEYLGAQDDSYDTPGAVESTVSNNNDDNVYPPPLYVRGIGSSGLTSRHTVDTSSKNFAASNMLLSSALTYSSSGTPHKNLKADVSQYEQYNLIPYPDMHFGFAGPGDYVVGKHNWWSLYMHPEIKHMNATGLVRNDDGNGSYLDREYVLSLYELPAQTPISGATAIKLGQIGDVNWTKVSISGSVVGESVETAGSASFDKIASRKGATLSSGTTVGTNGETVTGASTTDRDTFDAENKGFYPISRSSDFSRAMFIPLKPGNDFFDRYATMGKFDTSPVSGAGNRLSAEHWYQYSMGCNRCAMILDVIEVTDATDQTPTGIRFSYISSGSVVSQEFFKGDNSWPDSDTAEGDLFPFHVSGSVAGRPALEVAIERLEDWLPTLSAAPDGFDVNHSLVINTDYTQTNVVKPSFPSIAGDICVLLNEAEDLSFFPKGFSLVTNLRTYVVSDISSVAVTAPAGVTDDPYTPPFSLFCPELRVGLDADNTKVEVNGSLHTLGDAGTGAINVTEIKMGTAEQVSVNNTTLNLKKYEHPGQMPPINHMNWLIVVQRVK